MRGIQLKIAPLLVLAALVACALLPTMAMAANSPFTGGADQWPAYVPNDNTPVAVHFSASAGSGLATDTTYYLKVRFIEGTTPAGTTNRGFTWNPVTQRWVQERENWTSFPVVSTDASGALSSWAFVKFGDDAKHRNYRLLISLSSLGDSSTFNGSLLQTVTVLDPRVDASWVHNGVATGKAAAKRAAVTDAASSTVFALNKTEAQMVDDDSNAATDDEDWGPAGIMGDFRMSVPASTAIGVNLNQATWAPAEGFVSGPADVDLAIGAADTIAPTAPALIGGESGDETASLTWTAATDDTAVSGYYVYRWSPAPLGAAYSPVHSRIATLGVAETTFADSGLTNGTTYLYEVRAFDAATDVGPRSDTVTITPPVLVPTAEVAPASPDGAGGWYLTAPTVTLTAETSRTALYSFETSPSTWTTYTAPIQVPSGVSSLTYRDTDGVTMRKTVTLDFKVDGSAPSAAMSVPAFSVPNSNSRTFRASWGGADSVSGVASYEVEYRTSPSGAWVPWRASTPDTSAWFTGAAGSNNYFRVRSTDAAGNVGAWSAEACTVVPFDQSKARFSGSWKTARSSVYYSGSSRYATKKGGYATLPFTKGTLYLVAKTGPKMGKMAVYLGGGKVGTVSLYSKSTKYRQVFKLFSRSSGTKAKTAKLVNLGTKGRSRVEIDGFALKN
jgi:hypothetical protein